MAEYSEYGVVDDENSKDCPKETVCIDAYRVYDSCGDKNCLQDLQAYFTQTDQVIIEKANNIRIKDVDIITVYVDLDPVPFHRGFYGVDMTYFFEVTLDAYMAPAAVPVSVKGLSMFNKKVVLYGSEGNVKIFSSDFTISNSDNQSTPIQNLPRATVQVAKPIGLTAGFSARTSSYAPCCQIPNFITNRFGGEFVLDAEKKVAVTIGIFTIVQIERNVQMLVPTYDFCVPNKECVTGSDDPCEMFERIEFPTEEFFPPKVTDLGNDSEPCGKRGVV